MNSWLLAILILLLFSYFIETIATILNSHSFPTDIPSEFIGFHTLSEYRTSQEYNRAHAYLSLVQTSFSTLLIIFFIIVGGFNAIDEWARNIVEEEIVVGLLFIGMLMLLSFLVSLPFSVYSTFVIEERFGFNNTTVSTFIIDIFKGFLLALFIGAPLLSGILWFFMYAGPHGWLYCWLGIVLFSLGFQFLAPIFILPLFNKFSRLEEGPLRESILAYAQQERFSIQEIFTMDSSKRSSKVNAFFIGFGQFKKIVFFDTLLEKLKSAEILAILAHEMGHYKLKHIPRKIAASVLHIGLMLFLISLLLYNHELFTALGMANISVHASLVFFGLLFSPINLVVSVFFNHISRLHEFAADKYAAETIGSAEHLISGLKKLSGVNLINLTPHPFMVYLHYSHPPILERIKSLKILPTVKTPSGQ